MNFYASAIFCITSLLWGLSSATGLTPADFDAPSPRMMILRLRLAHPLRFRTRRWIHFNPHRFHPVMDAENVFHIIKNLPRDCFTYETEGYEYEYCHMDYARQRGKLVQDYLREEWSLGAFTPTQSIQKYSPRLRMAKISLESGTPCSAEHPHLLRKSKVKFLCAGRSKPMQIVGAREKSVCNYRILVHVPELC